nr:hypothetical protein [Tanacetum cinerariifolium]
MLASVEVSDESDPKLTNRPIRRRKLSGITFRDTLNVPKKKLGDRSEKLKGLKGKQPAVTLMLASVEVSDESDPKPTNRPTRRRKPSGITFRDTPNVPKKKSASKEIVRSQPHARGSSKGIGISVGVLDESTVILTSSSEGTGEESEYSEEENVDEEIEWLTTDEEEENKDDDKDDRSINFENTDDDKETNDEFVHGAPKHTEELIHEFSLKEVSKMRKIKNEQAKKQQMPKYSVKASNKVALDENDQKSALFQTMTESKSFNNHPAHKALYHAPTMTESKSFNNHPAHKALYHALMESLLADEEGMDQGVVDSLKQKKRQHDDQDKDPFTGPN